MSGHAGSSPLSDAAAAQTATSLGHDMLVSWLVFTAAAATLTSFSALFLDPALGVLTAGQSFRRCAFWSVAGLAFAAFVWAFLGKEEAASWLIGYTLEYALSFDNLFLFHVAFTSYGTPHDQVYRGIVTAMRWGIVVRFCLFFVSEEVFNMTFIFRWIFGAILVYSGFKVMWVEEDDNPTDNCLVRLVTRYLPVHHEYAAGSAFFVFQEDASSRRMPSDECNAVAIGCVMHAEVSGGEAVNAACASPSKSTKSRCRGCQATPLLLAVITLMIIDAVFAVDSVTAKVSMIYQFDDRVDFFLNFTSTAFAMLCMPSLYFIIALLVHLFRFLKYGLGAILILIGGKLLLSEHVHIREDVSALCLVSILGLSVLASLVVSSDDPPVVSAEASLEAGKAEAGIFIHAES